MDLRHSMVDKRPILTDFLQKLADSGYTHPTRMEIVKSAARKFFRQLMDQEAGGSRIYRSSDEMAKSRRLKELANKTWYKSKRGGQRITPGKNVPRVSLDKEVAARKVYKTEVEQKKPGEPRGSRIEDSP